jgi:hypothetical protein
MPSTEAHVGTERAARYLVQFCHHLGEMGRMPAHHHGDGGAPPVVSCTETSGEIRFEGGRCTLEAGPDALFLRLDAADDATLRRLRDSIGSRLETIGRRDGLTVTWRQPED